MATIFHHQILVQNFYTACCGRQLSHLPLLSICARDGYNIMRSVGCHCSSCAMNSTNSKLHVVSYKHISVLLLVGVILGVSFDSNGIGIVARILFVLCYAVKMIMLVLWVDSEIDVPAGIFYLSFCGTYRTSNLHTQINVIFCVIFDGEGQWCRCR